MKMCVRVFVMLMMFCFAVRMVAQDEIDFDPEADFTNTYTFEDITVHYPDILTVFEVNFQIMLTFDDAFRDYIIIATPQAFAYFGIPHDTLEIAAQAVFDFSPGKFDDARTYAEAVRIIDFAGYNRVITFEREVAGTHIITYTLMIDDSIFAAILVTQQTILPVHIENRVLERVLDSLSIDAVQMPSEATTDAPIQMPIEATTDAPIQMPIEATTDAPVFEPRPAPMMDESLALTQTVRLYDDEIVLSIPEDWVVVEETFIVATSAIASDAIYGQSQTSLQAGEIALQIIHPRRMMELGLDEVNIHIVTQTLQYQFPNSPAFMYEGLPYAAYLVPVSGVGVPAGAFFIVFQADEAPEAVMVLVGVTGDYEAVEALIIGIMSRIEYKPS